MRTINDDDEDSMARVSPILTNFTAGELSPRLEGRVDLAKYANGCRALENMTVHPHGGASRRSGTRFVAAVKDHAARVRLVPFEFSTVQAYMLEFGPGYVRFYRDEGRIESPPGTPYEILSPYGAAALAELQFAQSADVMYLAHPDHAPHKLARSGHTAWMLAPVGFKDGPYLDVNATATTIAPSATSGAVTLTASAALFAASDVGRLVRLKHGTSWGWATITGFISATQVAAQVGALPFGGTGATAAWQFGAWWRPGSYPACVSFYEERLFFAGSREAPQTIWASRSGDFENFGPTEADGTLSDDSALAYTIATDQVNAIRWLSPGAVLAVGTAGGEFTLRASAQDEPLTPANGQVKRQTTRGCAWRPPVRVDSVVLFLQRAGRKIREFVFAFETDGYQAPDLTLLAEHVTAGGIGELAYMREPDSTLWAARADGVLLGMTYERPQEVVAWHRHPLGGRLGGGPAKVESLAVIPAPDGGHDQLWLAVARTIAGATRRSIEFLEAPFADGAALADAFFVDCGLTYAGAAAATIAGLDHLEGETVAVLADGAVHPDRTVSGGAIALDRPAAKVHVGLPYRARLQTLRIEAGAADGTAQGKAARIFAATVRLWNSLGCKVGFDETLETIPFRSSADAMGAPPAVFTGDRRVVFPKGQTTAPRVTVAQDQPLPLTVLAIMPRLTLSEG